MSKSKRKTLGRGLSALLGDESQVALSPQGDGGIRTVPIEFLHPGKYQPRHVMDPEAISELAASIIQKGVLQPLLVRQHSELPGEFEIIAGERRWRASQQAQLHELPVIVKEFSDAEALEVGLIENLQRQDLSPIEEADGYQRLMDEFSHTQEVMAQVVGKSRSHIANTLRLLKLPGDVKAMVEGGKLTAGHARALIGSEEPLVLARKIVSQGLNVRQAEKLASKAEQIHLKGGPPTLPLKNADTLALERNMTALLGLQVDITTRAAGGVLSINYKTLDQLDDVLHRLSNGPRGASSIPADAEDISFSQDMSGLQDIFDETDDRQDQPNEPSDTLEASEQEPGPGQSGVAQSDEIMAELAMELLEPAVDHDLSAGDGITDDLDTIDTPGDVSNVTDATEVEDMDKLMAGLDEPLLGEE